jgi:acyl dehydratase
VARFLEDFNVGDSFDSAGHTVTAHESEAFARAYDPQPFHLDEESAKRSIFRGLTASGWLTAAVTMRLTVDAGMLRETGIIGMGIDDLRWLAPVRPGDTLRVRGEVVEKIRREGDSKRGTLRVLLHTINQDGVVVMSEIANVIVPVKP